MGAGDLLRSLDRRVLPRLARGMTRLTAGPIRLRLLTVLAVGAVAAVLVSSVWATDRRPVGDDTVGDVVRVGVVEGQSIPDYVAASRDELATLLGADPAAPEHAETYALVTFAGYLGPDRLPPVLGGVSVAEVFARVPLPARQTQIMRMPAFRIPADVAAGMAEAAERKDKEAADYRRLSAALTGGDAQEQALRRVYESNAAVAAAEATAYRARCSCIYAAVVRARPAALSRVADRTEVRAVDPAPEVSRLDRAVFLPPLPEQDGRARPPADGTLPGGSPSTVPPTPSGASSAGAAAASSGASPPAASAGPPESAGSPGADPPGAVGPPAGLPDPPGPVASRSPPGPPPGLGLPSSVPVLPSGPGRAGG